MDSHHTHQTKDQAKKSGSCCGSDAAAPKHVSAEDKLPAGGTAAETNATHEKPSHGGCCGGH